ncbi:hypothetical protein OHB15_14280 [Streptosporangium subroseum]|nr:hypothetical protein OHB15_14280 [Streptosporangium subroseum]
MLTGGVAIKELAEYLGHADPAFTLRVYAHMQPGSYERARQAIDDRLFRPRFSSDGTGTEQSWFWDCLRGREVAGSALPLAHVSAGQRPLRPSSLAMSMRWTSLVPSPISRILASR